MIPVFIHAFHNLALALQKELSFYGMHFIVKNHARDLGISHTAAARRPSQLFRNRFLKRKTRVSKVIKLAKISKRCRKLFTGSVYSSATWGHQASGISDSSILELDREALACSGINPAGRCRTMGLIAAYGLQGTPRSRLVRETIKAWFDVIKLGGPKLIKQIRAAWPEALKFIQNNPKSENVVGLMTNLILILTKAKWTPSTYSAWRSPDGDTWSMTGSLVSPDIVASQVNKDLFISDFARAEGHYNGKGRACGIHADATLSVLRNFKHTNLYGDKCQLETILAAAT